MSNTVIDKIFEENAALVEYLRNQKELSFLLLVQEDFKKSLLLAIASYFEALIMSILVNFFSGKSSNNTEVVSFIKIKSLNRNFYSLFDWNKNNVNGFFALFGNEFKEKMMTIVSNSDILKKGIKSFLTLGNERNILVHNNFGELNIDLTHQELYDHYKAALHFIHILNYNLNNTIIL